MLEIVDCVLAPLEMLSKKKGGKKKKKKKRLRLLCIYSSRDLDFGELYLMNK